MPHESHDLKGLIDVPTLQGMFSAYSTLLPSSWQLRQDDGELVCEATTLSAAAVAAGLSRVERAAHGDGAVLTGGLVDVQVPVKLRDRVLGALHVRAEADGRLSTQHLHDLGQQVARVVEGWAADRFEVKNLVSELVLRYEELSVLYDASETIVSNMDLEEVSRLILTKAKEILDVKTASLMLVDTESNTLRVKDALGLNHDLIKEIRLKIGEEISGWVAREGKPLLIEDIETHPDFRKVNKENYATRSLLSVPLKIKDRVIGVLNVNNKESGEVFNSGDLKLLAALGSLAAISIENATTYKNAITDRLTQLYNYGYFREQLYKKVDHALKANEPVSLLMFDIDHFKYFNDRNGHELGNVCLVGVAGICMENCRQRGDRLPDLVARYGGEEFLILLHGVPKSQAAGTAERVRYAIETTQFEGGQNQPMGKVTISVGVAEVPSDAMNGDDLIDAAIKPCIGPNEPVETRCNSPDMDDLNMDLFDPFDRFIEINFKGQPVKVPNNNLLLRCFQYVDMDSITYGRFCWNNECGNCEIQYVMQEGDAPTTARSCQTRVIEGMRIVNSTRHVRLKIRPK